MDRNELARLAFKHGVEDPPSSSNELRYRRLEALLAETQAEERKRCTAALMDADHLASCADRLLAALNQVAGAQAGLEVAKLDGESVELGQWQTALERAKELRSECWGAVQNAAYNYRKRAARAREERPNASGGGADDQPTPTQRPHG